MFYRGTKTDRPRDSEEQCTALTAIIDQSKRTYDFRVTTDDGTRVARASGLRWRMAALRTVGSICIETAAAPPAQAIDVAEVSVLQEDTP